MQLCYLFSVIQMFPLFIFNNYPFNLAFLRGAAASEASASEIFQFIKMWLMRYILTFHKELVNE